MFAGLHSHPLDRLDFCRCHFAAENGEQDLTILPPAFVRSILTAKPSALLRRLLVGRLCGGSAPAPPTSPEEQDKGKCGTGGRRIWDERRAAGIVPMCWNDYTTAPARIQEKFDNRRQQTEAPRCGHLGLRHSPQTRMNTGFLGRSKPRRGAG